MSWKPLVCSHCQGRLRPVSFIEDALVIRRILEHLGQLTYYLQNLEEAA